MTDLGERYRALFDRIAPPIDGYDITRPEAQIVKSGRGWLIGVAAAVLVLVVGSLTFMLGVWGPDGGVAGETDTTLDQGEVASTTASSTSITTLAPVTDLQPDGIACSTELDDFPCQALIDGDFSTEWQAPGGQWDAEIEFYFEQPVAITEIGFVNIGDEVRFGRNGSIRRVVLWDPDSSSVSAELLRSAGGPQWVTMDTQFTSVVFISLTDAYRGEAVGDLDPFDELALAEIVVRGRFVGDSAELEEVPQAVRDYWDLAGTLESVADEPGWLCPARGPVGHSARVDETIVPDDLKWEIPTRTPSLRFYRDSGPACQQPPILALLGDEAGVGVTIWPQTTRLDDSCPPETCFSDNPPTRLHLPGGEAVIEQIPSGDLRIWWYDPSGTPLYAESSGISEEQAVGLIGAITVDLFSHRAAIQPDAVAPFTVVVDQESVGQWVQSLSVHQQYGSTEDGFNVSVSRRVDYDATAFYAANPDALELVYVNGVPAAWLPQHGNFLSYTPSPGVHIWIEGPLTLDEAIAIAEQLQPEDESR